MNKETKQDDNNQQTSILKNPVSLAQIQARTKIDIAELMRYNEQQPPLEMIEKAKLLNCSIDTIVRLNKQLEYVQSKVENFKLNRADILAAFQLEILAICLKDNKKKMTDANFRDLMVAFGIASDKEQRAREGTGNATLSGLLRGIHINVKEGGSVVISPYTKEPAIDITPQKQESQKDTPPQDVVVKAIDNKGTE